MDLTGEIKFDEKGLVPVVVQDWESREVLMVAYMNKEAFELTVKTGLAHYWSRSRNKLWKKGETSGNIQLVKSISIDCDNDTLLLTVEQKGAACHTGNYSCFYRCFDGKGITEKKDNKVDSSGPSGSHEILNKLYRIIEDRRANPKEGSYTNYLFEKGTDKILKKVGEETSEVIIAAKNNAKGEIVYEISDLVYHLFVLMVEKGVTLEDIYTELASRHKEG